MKISRITLITRDVHFIDMKESSELGNHLDDKDKVLMVDIITADVKYILASAIVESHEISSVNDAFELIGAIKLYKKHLSSFHNLVSTDYKGNRFSKSKLPLFHSHKKYKELKGLDNLIQDILREYPTNIHIGDSDIEYYSDKICDKCQLLKTECKGHDVLPKYKSSDNISAKLAKKKSIRPPVKKDIT